MNNSELTEDEISAASREEQLELNKTQYEYFKSRTVILRAQVNRLTVLLEDANRTIQSLGGDTVKADIHSD